MALTPKPLSFDAVAKALNKEFGTKITRKTVHEWCQMYGWVRPTETAEAAQMPPAAPQQEAPVPPPAQGESVSPPEDEEFEWERMRGKFLARLAGVAETCLAVDIDPVTKQPKLVFRDDDSRFKVGMAAVELLGKINSGKFEPPEQGDKIPQLKEGDVQAIVAFFVKRGSPEPKLGPVIDITPVEDDGADSNRYGARLVETRSLPALDRSRDND